MKLRFAFLGLFLSACAGCVRDSHSIKQTPNGRGGMDFTADFTSVHRIDREVLLLGHSSRPDKRSPVSIALLKIDQNRGRALFRCTNKEKKQAYQMWIAVGQPFTGDSDLGKSGVILEEVKSDSVVLLYNYAE